MVEGFVIEEWNLSLSKHVHSYFVPIAYYLQHKKCAHVAVCAGVAREGTRGSRAHSTIQARELGGGNETEFVRLGYFHLKGNRVTIVAVLGLKFCL